MRYLSGDITNYLYFVAVDATDLKTRETGLATWTVYRSRNGAAAAAFTTPTIIQLDAVNMPGVYALLLNQDMTIDAGDVEQEMVVHITHAGMAPVTRSFLLFRSPVTAGQTLQVTSGVAQADVSDKTGFEIAGTTTRLDALRTHGDANWASAAALHSGTAQAGAAGSVTLAASASAVNDYYKGAVAVIRSGTGVGQDARVITAYNGTTKVATTFPNWATNPDTTSVIDVLPAGTQHVIDILADTAVIGTPAGASIAADISTRATPVQVNTEVDTALADIHLNRLFAVDYDPALKPGVATALLNELVESNAGVSRYTANALSLAPTGGSAPTAAAVADAVWDEARADHVAAGSFGQGVASVQGNVTGSAASVTGAVGSVAGSVAGSVGSVTTAVTVGTNNDKAGYALSAAGVQAVWDALTTALATVGSIGKRLADNIDATISGRATQASVDAVKTDTAGALTRLPAALVGGRIDADASAISGSAIAADKLEASVLTIETGAAIAGTLSTTAMTTNLTEATNDHYVGRVIIWTSGALLRQASPITAYNGTSKLLTYTAVTEAPAAADAFIIV